MTNANTICSLKLQHQSDRYSPETIVMRIRTGQSVFRTTVNHNTMIVINWIIIGEMIIGEMIIDETIDTMTIDKKMTDYGRDSLFNS